MWDVYLRRWIDLIFWWVPRKEEPPKETEQARGERAPEPAARPGGPDTSAAAQRPSTTPAAEPRPAPKPAARPAAEAEPRQPEKPVAPPVPDDLTEIKGIGPAMQNRLRALGITTFAELAAADPDQLMARLKGSQPLSRGRVRHWTEAARERART